MITVCRYLNHEQGYFNRANWIAILNQLRAKLASELQFVKDTDNKKYKD
jgi:hypothetical protein